ELVVAVDPGQLGRLAAQQHAAGSSTDDGDPLDELGHLLGVDRVRRDVVEQEQRFRTGRGHVVDAVGGEIGPAISEAAALAREDQLRSDAVRRRREEPPLVERIETREDAEAGRPRRLDRLAEALNDGLAFRDRDTGSVVRSHCRASLVRPHDNGSYTRRVTQLALPLVAAVMYAIRARTLARRGTPVPRWRIASFAGAVVLFAVALSPPLDWRAEELFSFHMIQHVLLGDLAPLLFVLGLTGPLLRPLLALRPVAALRPLAHQLVALPLWTINLYVWHTPFLYEAAVRHDGVHALEHFCFFTAGALMWAAVMEV